MGLGEEKQFAHELADGTEEYAEKAAANGRNAESDALLVESPMFRYECCEHCRSSRCPRHDGHPDPCSADPLVSDGCQAGSTMIGEPSVTPPGSGRAVT